MCGRYKQTSPFPTLAEAFGIAEMPAFDASGVVAPGMKAPVIRGNNLSYMTWGFVPHWSKEDLKTKIINARLETLEDKPSFRKARRCIVPANGFFEWDKSFKPSKPVDFHLANDAPFAFAGLWDEWTDKTTGEVRETFCIVTTAAVAPVAAIHDRMPVILMTASARAAWNNMEIFIPDSIPLLTGAAVFAHQGEEKKTAQLALL
jgi:putative SOS response-associated peptidase YedK